jgi:hypothetical protein
MLDDATSVVEEVAGVGPGQAAGERAGQPPLQVHTRPPIHWLNFHRAGEAIEAGGRALDAFMPVVQRALSGVAAERAGAKSRPTLQDALAQ